MGKGFIRTLSGLGNIATQGSVQWLKRANKLMAYTKSKKQSFDVEKRKGLGGDRGSCE
jgi:hypothetical protein